MEIAFTKMSGAGNDFIFLGPEYARYANSGGLLARVLCPRKTSVGADGLVLVDKQDRVVMHYYNSDGTRASFCGNGARCLVVYCIGKGIATSPFEFESDWGRHIGKLTGGMPAVSLPLPEIVEELSLEVEGRVFEVTLVRSGVPHAIIMTDEVDTMDVKALGRKIRYHMAFGAEGANVDFVSVLDRGRARVRTYERGVEDETLACGSGCVAAGYLLWKHGVTSETVDFEVASGEVLSVEIDEAHEQVLLAGPATIVYEGRIDLKELGDV